MDLNERMAALDARIAGRMADLDRRIAERFGTPSRGTGAPEPDAIRPPEGRAGGKRRALFVGLSDYDPVRFPPEKLKRLGSCARDAKAFAAACREAGGWQVRVLLDGQATVRGIGDAIAGLAAETAPGDTALVFVSTHGGRDTTLLGSLATPDENDTCLVAYDGCYWEKDFRSDLRRFRRGAKLVVVVNACHSGGLFEREEEGSGFAEGFVSRFEEESRSGDRDPDRILLRDIGAIAAAAKEQTSIGNASPEVCSEIPEALVREGWIGGSADGFTDSVVRLHGETAVRSAAALCKVKTRAAPHKCNFVTFLDMALYAVWKWKDISHVQFAEGMSKGRHLPQFYNPRLLHSVLAGACMVRGAGAEGVPESAPEDRGAPPDGAGSAPEERAFGSGTRYGLFVGINKYGRPLNPLSGCVADARNMAAVCAELGGWKDRNCTMLLDGAATSAAIRGTLRSFAEAARPGDVVLYFQSSHGGPNGRQPSSNDTCLCTYDDRYEEAALREDLSRFRKGVKVVVVIDACYSGGLFEKGVADDADPDDAVAAMAERVLSRLGGKPDDGRVTAADVGWITAAANRQTSLDHGENGGYFTTFTLVNNGWRAGMADGAAGSDPKNGLVTFLDLALFAKRSWGCWQTADGKRHEPQYFNPELLRSVIAGRVGSSASRDTLTPPPLPTSPERSQSRCVFCGSVNRGRGCPNSPHGRHRHPSDGKHCIWCNSVNLGRGCPHSPTGYHER